MLDIFSFTCDLLLPARSLHDVFALAETFHITSIEGVEKNCISLIPGHDESSCSIVYVSGWSSINGNVKRVNYSLDV